MRPRDRARRRSRPHNLAAVAARALPGRPRARSRARRRAAGSQGAVPVDARSPGDGRSHADLPACASRRRDAGGRLPRRLPAVYARKDAGKRGFLRTWLETPARRARRSRAGDRRSGAAPRSGHGPRDHLAWLASWMAVRSPPTAERRPKARALLLDAQRLYDRRGTVAGLREMVRLYTGVDCEIVESFRHRRSVGARRPARLGFDTGLLPALPDGMVVPGPSLPEPSLQGLRASTSLTITSAPRPRPRIAAATAVTALTLTRPLHRAATDDFPSSRSRPSPARQDPRVRSPCSGPARYVLAIPSSIPFTLLTTAARGCTSTTNC